MLLIAGCCRLNTDVSSWKGRAEVLQAERANHNEELSALRVSMVAEQRQVIQALALFASVLHWPLLPAGQFRSH